MIGAGAVVPKRLGRVTPQKNGAGVPDLLQPLLRFGDRELQVLRSNAVGDVACLVEVFHFDQRAAPCERLLDDFRTRQTRKQSADAFLHSVEECFVGRNQDCLRSLMMFGLRKQVHCDPVGRGLAIADDQNLGRAGNHVDADRAEHPALCRYHPGVPGPHDLVDLRDGLRAESQRSDRLRAADGEHSIDFRNRGGCEHERMGFSVWRGHAHDELADPGDPRRNGVHQHRRGIGRQAAGDIHSDTLERRHALAECRAIGLRELP